MKREELERGLLSTTHIIDKKASGLILGDVRYVHMQGVPKVTQPSVSRFEKSGRWRFVAKFPRAFTGHWSGFFFRISGMNRMALVLEHPV